MRLCQRNYLQQLRLRILQFGQLSNFFTVTSGYLFTYLFNFLLREREWGLGGVEEGGAEGKLVGEETDRENERIISMLLQSRESAKGSVS